MLGQHPEQRYHLDVMFKYLFTSYTSHYDWTSIANGVIATVFVHFEQHAHSKCKYLLIFDLLADYTNISFHLASQIGY